MRGLSPWLGVEVAAQIFAVLALLSPSLGALVLSRALHGRVGAPAVLGFGLSLNLVASWGFLNFLFSLGFVLGGLGLWISWEPRQRWRRVLLFVPILLGLGCLHLISAGILLAFIAAWELSGELLAGARVRATTGRLVVRLPEMIVLLVPVLVLVAMAEQAESQTGSYFGFDDRLEALYSPFLFDLNWSPLEASLGLAVAALLALGLALRWVVLPRRCWLMLALMVVLLLLAPAFLSGVWGTHLRLPLPVMLALLACGQLSTAPRRRLAAQRWVAVTALAMAAHLAAAFLQGAEQDHRISEFRAALAAMPRGSTLLPALDLEREAGSPSWRSLYHIASYATVDRSAFVPTLFTIFEIGLAPAVRDLASNMADAVPLADLRARLRYARVIESWANPDRYDFIVVFRATPDLSLAPSFEPVHQGSFFTLFRRAGIARGGEAPLGSIVRQAVRAGALLPPFGCATGCASAGIIGGWK
jgi:hypothetical protein